MKLEQTECSEMSAYKIQTWGNYPEENIQHSEHGESLKSRITQMCELVNNVSCSCCFVRTLLTSSNQTVECRIYNKFDIKGWLEEEGTCFFPNRVSNVSKLLYRPLPIPVAALSKAWVCGFSLAGIVGSKPAAGIEVFLLRVLYIVR